MSETTKAGNLHPAGSLASPTTRRAGRKRVTLVALPASPAM